MRPAGRRQDLKAGLVLSGVGLYVLLALLLSPLWLGILVIIAKGPHSWTSFLGT